MRSITQVRLFRAIQLFMAALAMLTLPLAPVIALAQQVEAAAKNVDWLRGSGETLEMRIAGEIVDQSGKASDSATLAIQRSRSGETTDLKFERDGSKFVVWVPLGKPGWSFVGFYGSSADGKQMVAKRIAHRELRQAAIDGLPLQLKPFERTMEIKVVDKAGPVEGANVFVDTRTRENALAITDKEGIARFGMPAKDEPYEITAWTADHRIGGYQFSRQPTRDAKLAQHTIELSACRPQKVRFLQDSDGKPIELIDGNP